MTRRGGYQSRTPVERLTPPPRGPAPGALMGGRTNGCIISWPAGRPWCTAWQSDGLPDHGCELHENHDGDHRCRCGATERASRGIRVRHG